jgi:SRSO17 transposase
MSLCYDYSMRQEELREARCRFEAFLDPLLPLMGRSERRKWGGFYIQGMMLEGGRKTAAGMSDRYGGNAQAMQQFVSQSPWDWRPVRRALAMQMVGVASSRCAWVLDDTGFPKKGNGSVGVARQYSGTLGKVGNCQIGVSLNYATDEGCFPLDFELYLPEVWIEDAARREKAGVPADITFKRKWEQGLEMIDAAMVWGVPQGVIVTDAGYGVATEFRRQLEARELSYVVGITGDICMWRGPVMPEPVSYQGFGRPHKARMPETETAAAIAKSLPEDAWSHILWREGTKGPMQGRFAAIKVRPSHGYADGADLEPVIWLLIEWPAGAKEPTKYWLSNLSDEASLRELVYWAKIRWWVEQNYQQLKDDLGLDHFEGRSYNGWHHHVTLTMIAFGFLVMEGFRVKKNYWVDPPSRKERVAEDTADPPWLLPHVRKTSSSRRYFT